MIRQARRADIPQITTLWNAIIRDTVITFNPQEKSEREVGSTILSRARQDHPFLVSVQGGHVLGFATYAQFRSGLGYARTMEHSINLAPAARGLGLGRALLTALEDHATARGVRAMVGAITGDNEVSLKFHAIMGYVLVGRMPQVGWKFGKFHDLVLMQKLLDTDMSSTGKTG